ncbi:proton channel OTOP3 [Gallus gallus]|uniref:Otopetrin 3 n=1 Tax=Gallus gallus TaxID=9031 RepID=A0A8V1APS5_CHICK|nr:proton channel OTOP3 [Gallus gallus]XP_040505854.1 proton channel OTOP3 [Gallus gallus]XP_420115.4 proton channel OTOP3 [Gallus gallus]
MAGNKASKQKFCHHCNSRSASAPPGTSTIHYEKSWLYRHCSLQQRDRQAQKSGQLFSGLLALNVVFLGSAFISSMIFNHVAITLADVWILLSILKVLCLCWIIYYLLGTSRQPHAVLYRDTHAGPVWIRGSLLLFGTFSILLNVFQIGYSVIQINCKSKVEIVFPSIEILFVATQAFFLWHHSKDCIQVQHNLTRCGLMLTIATNLLLWLLAVTNDSIHMEIESQLREVEQRLAGNETDSCACPNTTTCKVFQKGYILLYPFNTEYCLICCSVLYVMWKNVGRRISHHHITHIKPKFKLQGVVFGPLLGAAAVIIGICVFMMYQIQATGSAPNYQVFVLYYSYYIVLLPLMCVVAIIGTIIHTLEKRELDTLKNPTRSLDVVLLMGAALGQIAMSYFSIVAIVATNPRDMLNSLILSYSVLLIFQYITQNIFIIDGLQRQPFAAAEAQHTTHAGQLSAVPELPGEGVTTPSSNQERSQTFPSKEEEVSEEHNREAPDQRRVSVLELGQEFRRVSLSYIHTYSHLGWKRKALKEISFFLVLCNIILWIMPTFGAHPVFENGLQKSFYGYSTWFAIVNFGLPLSVFYRMHSVGGLLEVYVSA